MSLRIKITLCYPAYFLTDGALVNITVYDIKGRAVVKLLDKAFSKGGQNIKKDGWNGDNKAGNKLGLGYILFIYAPKG
jgi:flagellar hook assembly protein FlgD